MKLGRKCQLSVEVNPSTKKTEGSEWLDAQNHVTIPPDFTVEFEIVRQFQASSQTGTFKIYNLGEKTRNLLQKDKYATTERRLIQFRAGYDTFLPLVFNGQVSTAYSYRNGVNFITEIEAWDGGFSTLNGFSSITVSSDTPTSQVLANLGKSLPATSGNPIVGNFPRVSKRGRVLFGNTWGIIVQESENLATIDNGQVKILNNNEAIESTIPVVNADSGLLGSPRRSATNIEFDMIFEPRLTVGQILQLESATNRLYSGTYKVTGFTHKGIISPSVSGDCISKVNLFYGSEELKIVQGQAVQ